MAKFIQTQSIVIINSPSHLLSIMGFALCLRLNPKTAPKTICLDMVITGMSGDISRPAIPPPSAGSKPNHAPVINSTTEKIVAYNQIGKRTILFETGRATYPNKSASPIPTRKCIACPTVSEYSFSPTAKCPNVTTMSKGIPVIAISAYIAALNAMVAITPPITSLKNLLFSSLFAV